MHAACTAAHTTCSAAAPRTGHPRSALTLCSGQPWPRAQVYVLHAHQDPVTGAAQFDYMADFEVKQPILSMTTTTEASFEADGTHVFHLYCVQVGRYGLA